MKECVGCPIFDACTTRIAELETLQSDFINKVGGGAQVFYELSNEPNDALRREVRRGAKEAAQKRAGQGNARITAFFAAYPELQESYFDAIDFGEKLINDEQELIERFQSKCHGPENRKLFLFLGREALHCSSTYWVARLVSLKNRASLGTYMDPS